jgi:hypothetical protein
VTILKVANISAFSAPSGWDLRAHEHAPRRRVRRRAYGDDARLEHATGDGAYAHLDLLADVDEADVALRHAGLHPHGRQIGDRIELVARVAAHVLARTDFARDDVPAIGALTVMSGSIRVLALDACHLGLAAPEHAQAMARGRRTPSAVLTSVSAAA